MWLGEHNLTSLQHMADLQLLKCFKYKVLGSKRGDFTPGPILMAQPVYTNLEVVVELQW